MSQTTHPLDQLASRGWSGGLFRLVLGIVILGLIFTFTGKEALSQLLYIKHLPLFGIAVVLAILQRVIRVRKWSWLVEQTPLIQRGFGYLVRLQFVGLMANLLVPVSELLKIWAVSRTKRDAPVAIETITVDVALLSAAVGVLGGCCGALLTIQHGPWWLGLPGACLTVAAVIVLGGLRLRKDPQVSTTRRAAGLSLLEALCLLGVYGVALTTLQVPIGAGMLIALFPLLYLSHLVMLTPSGLGLREALFALVFASFSDTPAETAVTVALMVSATQLVVTLLGGGLALLVPGASLKTAPLSDA